MLRSHLCDYSDAYIVLKATIVFQLLLLQMKMIRIRKMLRLRIMLHLDHALQKLAVH